MVQGGPVGRAEHDRAPVVRAQSRPQLAEAGGVGAVAEILNVIDRATERTLLEHLAQDDPDLVEDIRRLMFVFEDMVFVDDRGIQELLKVVDNTKLTTALKTAPEEVKLKLFKNMSNRAATLLREDLESMGPTKVSDVEKAQQEIVQQIKDLESKGKAIVARGGEGDSFV